MKYKNFINEYNDTAKNMVLTAVENNEVYRVCDHELEPGKFVAYAWKDGNTIRYEEYWNISNKENLTPESVPDVSISIEMEY